VYNLGKNLENLNSELKERIKLPYYGMNDVKNIINNYIAENELDKDTKKGHVKLDPHLGKLSAELKPG